MYQILVVDDEPMVRKGIIESISRENLGIEVVHEAGSGREALSFMDSCLPDLIITDIKMPEMDGITFIKEVRKRKKEIPVVVVSGYSDFAYLQAAIRYGVNDYILKPVRVMELNSILETALEQSKMGGIRLKQDEILKETILYRMVSGTIGKHEVREKLESLGIVFRRGKYQVAAVQTEGELTTAMLCQIAAQLDKVLVRNDQGASFVHPNGEVLVVLCKVGEKEETKRLVDTLRKRIEEKCGVSCFLVSGEIVEETEELPYSYDTARKKQSFPAAESQGKEHSKLTKDVISYVQKHFTENITLKNLADQFYVNPSYLGYLFKKETGILFNDYVNRCRVSYVSDLLEHTSLKIYEIMEKVGIQDSHYFIRIYKKYKGMTPTEYRRISQK